LANDKYAVIKLIDLPSSKPPQALPDLREVGLVRI
jgi:hypothetical protein